MDRERWHRVERLFERALERPEHERRAFLEREAAGDQELVAEVASLLAHDVDAFMAGGDAFRSPENLTAGSTLGTYVIEGELGRGGMGVVYRGRDRRLDRPVAIKLFLNPLLAGDAELARLEREARILAQFNHPHIAAIYAIETTPDGRVFLVLELVEGASLAQRLGHGALPVEAALESCEQVARALATAHRRGVVHRDLKPENVIIDPEGTAKVLDFGIARAVGQADPDEPLAKPHVRGTPGYMSPELLRGDDADHRADVFAFGCLLYECLTGVRAFPGSVVREVVRATFESDPDLSRLPPSIEPPIRAMLARCLEKDPARRLGRMDEVVEILSARRRLTPSPTSAAIAQVPNNLPTPPSTFVGRQVELERLAELSGSTRLLSLVGPGGSGKTRLAIEHARALASDHPAGVRFLDLAPIAQAERVPKLLLDLLELAEQPQRPVLETVIEGLGTQRTLLLFDNCEHLQPACARLIESLLTRCPRVQILATSREALGLSSETAYPVPPLSLDHSQAAGGLPSSEAIELFCQRARAARPGFRLDAANAASVVAICERLEGIPLAIELVAARVRAMSPGEISRRLVHGFDAMTRGSQTAVRRHRTLRAAYEWSFNLLGLEERTLLRRLSVFSGGWSLEAAEEVASDPRVLRTADVLGVLTALVEKSLVVHHSSARSEGRYRMLETNRQYAREQLESSGEETLLRDQHLRYYVSLTATAPLEQPGSSHGSWLERLDEERENIESALAWAERDPGRAEAGLRICRGMLDYWRLRAEFRAGGVWIESLLANAPPDVAPEVKAQALFAAGNVATLRDDYVRARQALEDSMAILEPLGESTVDHRRILGVIAAREGEHDRARSLYESTLDVYRARGDRPKEERVLNDLGNLAVTMGDYETALARYRAAAALSQTFLPGPGQAPGLGLFTYLYNYMGAFEEALEDADHALEMALKTGMRQEIARSRINAGRALYFMGRLDEAESRLRAALKETEDFGSPFYQTFAINYLLPVLLDRRSSDGSELEALFQRSAALADRMGLAHAQIASLSLGGRVALGRGDLEAALERSTRAVSKLEVLRRVEGAEEEIYYTHAQILSAAGHQAAFRRYLERSLDELWAKTNQFRDRALRDRFLAHPASRAIIEAARQAGMGASNPEGSAPR